MGHIWLLILRYLIVVTSLWVVVINQHSCAEYCAGLMAVHNKVAFQGTPVNKDTGTKSEADNNFNSGLTLNEKIKNSKWLFGGFVGWDIYTIDGIYTGVKIGARLKQQVINYSLRKDIAHEKFVPLVVFNKPRVELISSMGASFMFNVGKRISYFTPYFSIGGNIDKIILDDYTSVDDAGNASMKKTYYTPSVGVGLGLQMKLTKDWFVDFNYVMFSSINDIEHTFAGKIYKRKQQAAAETEAPDPTLPGGDTVKADEELVLIGKQAISLAAQKFYIRFGISF